MSATTEILQQLAGVDEVAWGEDIDTMTSAQVYPITQRIDFSSVARAMIDSPRVVTYKDEKPRGIPDAWRDASFELDLELTGHGSATTGSISETALGELAAWAIGAALSPAAGTTCTATGTDVALTTAASATFPVGSMFRAGVKGDARGNGQWDSVVTHVLTTLTALFALDAAPVNADVVYTAQTIYTTSSAANGDITSKRFRALSPNFQAVLHGCFPKAWKLSGLGPGEVPHLTITVGVSWAEPISATFPDAVSTAPWTYNPTVVAAGSVVLQAYGTASPRTVVEARSVTIDVTMGINVEMGYAGANGAQIVTGAKRGPDMIKVTAILPAGSPSATPAYYDAFAATTPYQMMLSLNVGPTQAVGVLLRRLIWTGKQPMQINHNGLNAVQCEWWASSDPTGATEAAKAALVLGLG